jgi:single-stranded-DNA-specific exonuclease
MQKIWEITSPPTPDIVEKFPELRPIILRLLYNRNLTDQAQIDDFLNPNYDDHVLDPFLFKDMDKAVDRLLRAVHSGERVMIYGDYDADGVCSSTVLYSAFKSLGLDVDVYIPFRETEGYGLNPQATQQIIDQGFTLVVTIDCGVSNVDEVAMFQNTGVDVIILDHHQPPPVLPPAYAIINPAIEGCGYPFTKLCGAGVGFKFVQAIIKRQDSADMALKLPVGFDKWLLDIVALATVGDIMPLIGENRVLVKYGLMVLEKTRRPGLRALIDVVNNHNKIDTQTIGWKIVPRLNAAGRVNHASAAFNLLNSTDEVEAKRLCEALENNNKDRQQLTERMVKESLTQIGEITEKTKILWAQGDDWLAGVVGLVAGRLSNRYHIPTLAVARTGDKYVGSGRSIPQFNITAALRECAEHLDHFGGHSQACGFTVIGDDNFKKFQDQLTAIAERDLATIELRPIVRVDSEIKLVDLTWELWDELEKFEPFGEGNPRPIFASYSLLIEQVRSLGADGKHLRLLVTQEGALDVHKLIGFSFGEWVTRLVVGDTIDILFELEINEWQGRRELQLRIIDLRKCDN